MSIWGPILGSVAGGLIGGLFEDEQQQDANAAQAATNETNVALAREMADRNEAFARENAARNEHLQREFAQMGIQWRVKDAEAAGLHPLYALSGGGAAFSPSPAIVNSAARVESAPRVPRSSFSDMGQNLGRALTAALDPVQQAERALQLRLLEAQVDRESAHAAYFRSQAVTSGSPPGVPSLVGAGSQREPLTVIDLPYLRDAVRAKPNEQASSMSGDGGTAAYALEGHPMFDKFDTGLGFSLHLPSSRAGESLEGAGELAAAAVGLPVTIGKNLREWSSPLVQRALDYLERIGHFKPKSPLRIPAVRSTLEQYGAPNPWRPKRYR